MKSRSTPPLFTGRSSYPGTQGGAFEAIVTFGDRFEHVPGWLFAGLILAAWGLATPSAHSPGIFLALFSFGDWAFLAALPRANRSFGPPKFPTFLLLVLRLPWGFLPPPWAWLIQCTGTVLVIYGFGVEPLWLQVTYHKLSSPKLVGMRPLRLLHLSDLHIERTTLRERKLIEYVKMIAPDIIVFTGDILSYSNVDDVVAWSHAHSVLSQLEAPLGVFLTTGSPPVDRETPVARILDGLKIHWLRDSEHAIERDGILLKIVGLSCSHQPAIDGPKLQAMLSEGAKSFTILLYHSPDLAPLAERVGVDLQFSGHTHGGQVRLPGLGALYTSSLYGKKFEVGEVRVGSMMLFVSRGLGLEGRGAPRVRFLCRPEIALWEIGAS